MAEIKSFEEWWSTYEYEGDLYRNTALNAWLTSRKAALEEAREIARSWVGHTQAAIRIADAIGERMK